LPSQLDPLSALLAETDRNAANQRRAAQAERIALLRAEQAKPRAIVLVTTVYTCECGKVYRSPNPTVMLRYDTKGYENSVHYRRQDLERVANPSLLPHEHKLLSRTVPFCEECFGVSAQLLQPDTPKRFAGQVRP